MTFFMYVFWFDKKYKRVASGPMKFWELSDNLASLGHRVIVFAPDLGLPQQQTRARVVEIKTMGIPLFGIILFDLQLVCWSLLMIARFGCDVVYMRIMTSLVPLIIASLAGKPFILEINDNPFLRYSINRKFKSLLVKYCDWINFRGADAINAINERIVNRIHEAGVPASRLTVIESGANTELFRPYPKNEAKKELSLDASLKYVGFAGNYNHFHDYDSILYSAKKVVVRFPETRYLILCEGWKQRELPKIIAEGLGHCFILVDHVDYRRVPMYLSAMDVCLAPLKKAFLDSLIVKVFDYCSCSRPTIISRMGDYESLEREGCVVAVPPEDPGALAEATIALLSDPVKAEAMGARAREVMVKKYSRKCIAQKIAAMAEGLQKGRGK